MNTMQSKLLLPLLLLGAAVSLSGCNLSLLKPALPPIVAAGVLTGVLYAEGKGVTASQINSVCKAVLAVDSSGTATMAELTNLLNTKLESIKSVAAYVGVVTILESAFEAGINEQVAANPTVAQVQSDAAVVFNDCVADTGG